jgi:protein-S-isoprenylcysteine O-methyltransferase Ste14
MKGMFILGYAVVAYAAFLLSAGWAIIFLAGGIDTGHERPLWVTLAVNSGLLLAFALQHSVMARAGFKQRLTRLIPAPAERSTYVLVASLLMFALFGFWQPLPAMVWDVDQPWIWGIYGAGWILVVWSTFGVDHADFLGLKQARAHWRGRTYQPPAFTERRLYAWLRHPMMLGLTITFWATPHMSVGHLLFALSSTGYILVGIRYEERDLRKHLTVDYDDYARRVPALVPKPPRARV